MELRQQALDPLVRQRTPTRLSPHPRRRRIAAWIFSWRLDEELATGADPGDDPLLAARAQQLLSARNRHRLAESLRDAVERSVFPASHSAAAPLASTAIRADSGLLLALAARLDSDRRVEACGVARAQLLVTDGGSELYAPGDSLPLQGAVEAALIGLGG
jgi:hypothetical protein